VPVDDEKTSVEVSEETTSDTAPKGYSRKKLILFGGIGVAFLIVGVVLAIFVVGPMISGSGGDDTAGESSQVKAGKDADDNKATERDKPKKKKKKKKPRDASKSVVFAIKNVVVNPAGTGGSRFLSISLGFELESADVVSEFERREPAVRDALITILSSKTVAQLTDPKQKEIIRYQIKKRVSKLLDTDELTGVYYTDFVLQ